MTWKATTGAKSPGVVEMTATWVDAPGDPPSGISFAYNSTRKTGDVDGFVAEVEKNFTVYQAEKAEVDALNTSIENALNKATG